MKHTLPLLLTLLLSSIGAACNIPVFRYALERWKPDACEVIVLHDGSLTPSQTATLRKWESMSSTNPDGRAAAGNANVKIIRANVADNSDTEFHELWQDLKGDHQLPYVLVRTKLGRGSAINHWHGTLDQAEKTSLFDSPARQEIKRRLLAGHSVVWLLIESSDEQRTTAARDLAELEFKSLSQQIQLPEGVGLPGSELYAEVPLVVRFSLLEIDPADPKEQFLVSLLTGIRKQAHENGEPLLVPVFGRGRALEVIPANNASSHLMEDLTLFLSGACSCQVKEQNPGFDLLINADWDTELFGDEDNRPPDRSKQEGKNRKPVLLDIPAGRR